MTALLENQNNDDVLAQWMTPDAAPTTTVLPDGFAGQDIAGVWVVGILGTDMLVYSPTKALIANPVQYVFNVAVSANGT